MRTAVKGAALALGFALIQACAGKATTPGAQPTPQDRAGGGLGTLESEEESGGHFATMVDMLRGRVPGLQIAESPSGGISIRIRGDQSIYFNGPPLLVVDGVSVAAYSFSSTLRAMDPRDVRSIRVLKDVGSTSSYGTRGAHGVILISLKRR